MARKLFSPKTANKFLALGGTVRASSEQQPHAAANVIDGDPNTIWHTPWKDPAPPYPHELVVELPKAAKMEGITCTVRQDGNRNAMIKGYSVEVSADGKDWGQPVAKGEFGYEDDVRIIQFEQTRRSPLRPLHRAQQLRSHKTRCLLGRNRPDFKQVEIHLRPRKIASTRNQILGRIHKTKI
jgi:hypothetical protein